MNDDTIRGESDIDKVRAIALDLLRRNSAVESENAILLKEITRLTLELARSTDKGEQLALGLELRRINEMLAERNKGHRPVVVTDHPARQERRAWIGSRRFGRDRYLFDHQRRSTCFG